MQRWRPRKRSAWERRADTRLIRSCAIRAIGLFCGKVQSRAAARLSKPTAYSIRNRIGLSSRCASIVMPQVGWGLYHGQCRPAAGDRARWPGDRIGRDKRADSRRHDAHRSEFRLDRRDAASCQLPELAQLPGSELIDGAGNAPLVIGSGAWPGTAGTNSPFSRRWPYSSLGAKRAADRRTAR
jgi:hypothetical protein